MADKRKKKQDIQDTHFITATNPTDWKTEDTKSFIRSNAARAQHQRRREELGLRRNILFQGSREYQAPEASSSTTNQVVNKTLQGSNAAETDGSSPSVVRQDSPRPSSLILDGSYATGARAFQLTMLRDPDNVVGRSLTQLNTQVGPVLSRFGIFIDTQAPDFERRYGYSGWTQDALLPYLQPLIFKDAAPMAASLLVGSAHILTDRGERPSSNTPFLQLRGFAMQTIQGTLAENMEHAVSDEVIVAVALVAKCDAICGWEESHATHMKGIKQLMDIREGSGMRHQYGMLRLFVLWFDCTTADDLGRTELYLDHNDPAGLQLTQGGDDVHLTGYDVN